MNCAAYSTFEIKAFDEQARTFQGIASTPTIDLGGDIVDPEGAVYQLPLPFLQGHDHGRSIGEITSVVLSADGIMVTGHVKQLNEPPTLKERLDVAWAEMKSGLSRGLSIGFKPLKAKPLKDGGLLFSSWRWLELSSVVLPMNIEATIFNIKSFDDRQLAASGRGLKGVVLLGHSPGDSGPTVRKGFVTLIPRKYENL